MKVNDYKTLYMNESRDILQALENGVMKLESEEDVKDCIDELFRNAHNLKGMSGAMGYESVVRASHTLENVLDRYRKGEITVSPGEADIMLRASDLIRELVECVLNGSIGNSEEDILSEIMKLLSPICNRQISSGDGSISIGSSMKKKAIPDGEQQRDYHSSVQSTRVDLDRLDVLMDIVGELIISHIRLGSIARELHSKPLIEELASAGRMISDIQKEVVEARLVPVGQVFQRFKRLVRDVSKELGKKVNYEIVGSDIGLDRTVLENMVDPLIHLIRNAIDHGIESPEEREAAGKKAEGKLVLKAERERNFVVIEVRDDGRGIDLKQVMKREAPDGPGGISEPELSQEDLCRILTTPGFSTRENISRYSGRGIGMNVVKEATDSLGGSMRIDSTEGEGTTVFLQLPINLSIIKALIFNVGDSIHALPIEYVRETVRVDRTLLKTVRGKTVFTSGDGPVRVVKPWEVFNFDASSGESRYMKIIIVEIDEGTLGIVVDRIVGQQDVVIKSLPTIVRGAGGVSGATILGSGNIAFIWDPRIFFEGRCGNESNQEAVVLES